MSIFNCSYFEILLSLFTFEATVKDFPSIAKSAMIDYLKALTTATGNQQKTQSGNSNILSLMIQLIISLMVGL